MPGGWAVYRMPQSRVVHKTTVSDAASCKCDLFSFVDQYLLGFLLTVVKCRTVAAMQVKCV